MPSEEQRAPHLGPCLVPDEKRNVFGLGPLFSILEVNGLGPKFQISGCTVHTK